MPVILGGERVGAGPEHAGVEAVGAALWEGTREPVEVATLNSCFGCFEFWSEGFQFLNGDF